MEKQKVEKIPWILLIPWMIIWTAVTRTVECFMSFPVAGLWGLESFFMLLALLFVLTKVVPSFSLSTLAWIFIVTPIVVQIAGYGGTYYMFAGYSHTRCENELTRGWALPSFWMPSANAVRNMFVPSSMAPYMNEWIPVIFFWIIYPMGMWIMFISLMLVFRNLWVNVEAMPFPSAQTFILGQFASKNVGWIENKRLGPQAKIALIGVLIALLYYIPINIIAANPAAPDIYGYFKSPYFIPWQIGLFSSQEAFPILRAIITPLWIPLDPYGGGYTLLFLAPLDTLFSGGFIWFILYLVGGQVAYYLGYYSGGTEANMWAKADMVTRGDPIKGSAIGFGMIIAIFLSYIILNRRYLLSTIKNAIGSSHSTETGMEVVKEHRLGWIGFLVGLIWVFVIWGVSGISVGTGLIMCIPLFIWTVVSARCFSLTSTYIGSADMALAPPFFYPFWGTAIDPATQTPEQMLALSLINWNYTSWGGGGYNIGASNNGILGFKIADMAGIASTKAYIVMIVAVVVACAITSPLMFTIFHTFGWNSLPIGKEWDFMSWGDATNYANRPVYGTWEPHAAFGFILVLVTSFLRTRYAWFPLEPIGLYMGTFGVSAGWLALGIKMGITWIIKYLVIKIGGRRLYTDYAVPLAVGLTAGFVTSNLISGILGLLRTLALI
jgi:hypothetical protein